MQMPISREYLILILAAYNTIWRPYKSWFLTSNYEYLDNFTLLRCSIFQIVQFSCKDWSHRMQSTNLLFQTPISEGLGAHSFPKTFGLWHSTRNRDNQLEKFTPENIFFFLLSHCKINCALGTWHYLGQ